MSPAGGIDYLGDGLSEELSLRLAQVPACGSPRELRLRVQGRNVDVRKIGESLGVRNVLEGSVRRDGDSLRVVVQLIDTTTGTTYGPAVTTVAGAICSRSRTMSRGRSPKRCASCSRPKQSGESRDAPTSTRGRSTRTSPDWQCCGSRVT